MSSQLFDVVLETRDEHYEGEISAEDGHARIFDVALMGQDESGDLVDDAGAVLANSGDNQVSIHGKSLPSE